MKRLFLLPFAVLALLVGACQPTAEALPRLTDPKEIVEEALRTTAELDFAHVKLDVAVSGPDLGPQAVTVALEGDVDLDRREFHAIASSTMGLGGVQQAEILLVGTEMFTRFQGLSGVEGSDKWMRTTLGQGQDPRAGIPPTPAIAVALKTLLEDESLDTTLAGMETCGEAPCYRIEATVGRELIAGALGGMLFGFETGEGQPVDPDIPPVVLDIRIDEATRRLMSVSSNVSYEGYTVDVTAAFSAHDVKVSFLPPPPDQVDDNTGGFGIAPPQQVVPEVGNEVEPPN